MFRVEIAKAMRRLRTWLLAAALAGVPVLIVAAVKLSPPQPQNAQDAPPFLLQIVQNGLFVPLTGLAVVQPFFMSLAIGLFAGDAIAGEAQAGTLRYLLVRPVGRTRLLFGKYASAMALTGALLVGVILAGLLAGGVVFGLGTGYVLVSNGLSLGAVLGAAQFYGVAPLLWSFISPHGYLELTCIVIAGSAGLMLGHALLRPGLQLRREALARAARRAVELVVGTAPVLVIAGLIEGFISSSELPIVAKLAIGPLAGVALYSLLLTVGRVRSPH